MKAMYLARLLQLIVLFLYNISPFMFGCGGRKCHYVRGSTLNNIYINYIMITQILVLIILFQFYQIQTKETTIVKLEPVGDVGPVRNVEVQRPVYNINTQRVEPFRQIGILYNDNGDLLPLLGRRTYASSTRWNYYTITNEAISIKIPIILKDRECMLSQGCDELYDNDKVTIPELHSSFVVKIYNY